MAGVTLTACQSSQDKAREIRERAEASRPKPLVIPKPNKDIKVTETTLLHDQYGDAIVVELKNESKERLVNVPILVDIRDAKGKSVYRNNTAGLDFALNHIAVLEPGETFDWVNDQVTAQGKTAKVTVGQPEGKASGGALPDLAVSPPKLGHDFSGPYASGTVTNRSKLTESHLILFAVGRSGGRVVAAGRAQIKALKVDAKPGRYHIYFIGDPARTDITIEAPPTVLQ